MFLEAKVTELVFLERLEVSDNEEAWKITFPFMSTGPAEMEMEIFFSLDQ